MLTGALIGLGISTLWTTLVYSAALVDAQEYNDSYMARLTGRKTISLNWSMFFLKTVSLAFIGAIIGYFVA